MDEYGFPWIKFIILSLAFGIPIFWFAPTIKWKMVFTLAVPIGVGVALMGKSIRLHR